MSYFHERSLLIWTFAALACFGGCVPKVECDSPESRTAVLQIVSDDHSNALANYAARNSNVVKDVEKSENSDKAKPLYLLGEKLVTTSISEDKKTLSCSGAISAVVGNTKASKEINFTVQRSPDGKLSVSVEPFQF